MPVKSVLGGWQGEWNLEAHAADLFGARVASNVRADAQRGDTQRDLPALVGGHRHGHVKLDHLKISLPLRCANADKSEFVQLGIAVDFRPHDVAAKPFRGLRGGALDCGECFHDEVLEVHA